MTFRKTPLLSSSGFGEVVLHDKHRRLSQKKKNKEEEEEKK
jgi:hypothetical protein